MELELVNVNTAHTLLRHSVISALVVGVLGCAAKSELVGTTGMRPRLLEQHRSGAVRVEIHWRLDQDALIATGHRWNVSLAKYLDSETPRRVMVRELSALGYRMARCTTPSPTLELTILDAEYGSSSRRLPLGGLTRVNLRWRFWSQYGELASSHISSILAKDQEAMERALTQSFLQFLDTSVPTYWDPAIESYAQPSLPTPGVHFHDAFPDYRGSIVSVRTSRGDLTAFLVSNDGLALTSSRVAETRPQAVLCAQQHEHRVDLLCVELEAGVALLRIHGMESGPVPLRGDFSGVTDNAAYVVTANVTAGSSHRVIQGSWTREPLASFRGADLDDDTDYVREGAPVFDSDALVVGLIAGTRSEWMPGQLVTVVTPIDVALEALHVPFRSLRGLEADGMK